ncbi:alpha/beta hydrolase [Bradyrhizobium sp. UFLA01-814]|uniref:alpha/beta fold hydrolase n=1 Tax=Bradyrhizobium sp. UFLA01-814 TaxID=3023480 RepID=UPI00398B9A8A
MTNIVLVPGGWQGGWRNTTIAQKLRAQGYHVVTPTLTGLGERVHLANSSINLDTHIEDVANVLRFEDLTDVILCGHSYAGMVISGVADKMSERISALVYIDAFVPKDGDSWWDLAGDNYRHLALERSELDGFRVAPPAHMDPRCTPHPFACFRQAIRLCDRWKSVKEKVFIYATGWKDTPFTPTYEALLKDPEWTVKSFACGHNVVRENPEELVALITGLRVSQRARQTEGTRIL